MSEMPAEAGTPTGQSRPARESAALGFIQQPRILLVLLAAWEIVAVLVELLASRSFSLDVDNGFDGILAGRILSGRAVAMVVLYLYCARDPVRFHGIFWLALIAQGAAVMVNIYHLVVDHLEFEAIFVNLIVSGVLGFLVFVHLFQPRGRSDEYGV